MMKNALIPVLAIAAASVAVPAAAQNYDRYDRQDRYERSDRYDRHDRYDRRDHDQSRYDREFRGWQSISQCKYQLDRRIDQGLRNGGLTRREGSYLKSQLNSLVRLERRYMRGGLTRWERSDLDRRYDRLAAQVRIERRDNDRRGRRW